MISHFNYDMTVMIICSSDDGGTAAAAPTAVRPSDCPL